MKILVATAATVALVLVPVAASATTGPIVAPRGTPAKASPTCTAPATVSVRQGGSITIGIGMACPVVNKKRAYVPRS